MGIYPTACMRRFFSQIDDKVLGQNYDESVDQKFLDKMFVHFWLA